MNSSHREFRASAAVVGLGAMMVSVLSVAQAAAAPDGAGQRPNVLLIMTDDQGYGDMGVHGNPIIKAPNIDKLAAQSVEVKSFYVCPVCAPTRASLMTGRYNYRTGVTDTYLGRAMMHSDEVTLAEMLGAAGYRTGIFGKWHLGDSYPMRPMDQGFEQSLVHTGGGLCQPSGPPDNSYFDPSLLRNGRRVKTKGYCTDVFTTAAIDFIGQNRRQPFFVYLPYNCPHGPFQVAERYSKPYEKLGMKPDDFPSIGHKRKSVPANTDEVFGMVQNIDENLGRLFGKLEEWNLAQNTIVIFLTDNGPNGMRYDAGFRACKGSVYEGGIRTAFFVRWPERLKAGHKVQQAAAHVDVVPTLLEACGVAAPQGVKLDGRSILPLLEGRVVDWPDRTLYFQWHRGDEPVRYRAFAARSPQYKLLHAGNVEAGTGPEKVKFELYDLQSDPLEMQDIAAEHPEVVRRMRSGYEAWLADVGRDHGYEAPRALVGTPHEQVTTLTRQDWRGPEASWAPRGLGYWEIAVPKQGEFEVTCQFDSPKRQAVAHLKLQTQHLEQKIDPGTAEVTFDRIELKASPAERIEVWIEEEGAARPYGVRYVHIKRTR